MEEAEERHQVEIKVYKQKAKQLLYEHHNASAELRMNSKFEFQFTAYKVLKVISRSRRTPKN